MIAIIESYKAGLLSWNNWKNNVIAGIIVGVVALPLAMAFAIASGAKPEHGIYTAIIAGAIIGIFGGTKTQVAGPTGAFVVILATITAQHGFDGLQIATLIAGGILLVMGFLKLGNIIKFIPYPVVVGFTSGIAVIIFVGQWKEFFGLSLSLPIDTAFYDKFLHLIGALPLLNWKTTGLAFLSLSILVFAPRFVKSIPSPLIALLGTTFIQYYFGFEDVATIGSVFGEIPQSLPTVGLPDFTSINLPALILPAITIALLGSIESLLSAAAADTISGTKHNSNQELIGQGMANMIVPFFGGFAATGAIARTVTSLKHGGNSPIAALVHSSVLILTLLVFAPYATHIPLAVLSAILFVVAFNMSDIPEFLHIFKRAPWYDVFVLMTTFLLTVLTDLVIAVGVGVILAVLLFVIRLYQVVDIKQHGLNQLIPNARLSHTFLSEGVVYTIDGPLFFGVTEKIEHALGVIHIDPKFVVFRLLNVPFIDMTGLATLYKVIERYQKRHVKVYICEANTRVSHKISKIGLLHLIETKHIFESLEDVALHYEGTDIERVGVQS